MTLMGRKRSIKNKDFPQGLYSKFVRNKLRFYYRDKGGKEIYLPVGTAAEAAIEAVEAFNEKHRTSLQALLESKDKFDVLVSDAWPKVKQIMLKERADIAKSSLETFMNDCERFQSFFAKTTSKSIDRGHVNEYLDKYHGDASNNVRNRKLSFLQTVFEEFIDKGYMDINPAKLLKFRKKDKKKRQRLYSETFIMIEKAAPSYIKVAMKLALQTTHAASEISNMRYDDCEWFDTPLVWDNRTEAYVQGKEMPDNALEVYGMLKIKRKKNDNKAASAVKIPITPEIKEIIEESKRDGIDSPYIVHKAKKPTNKKRCEKTGKFVTKIPAGCGHLTQIPSQDISKEFSAVRDALDLKTWIKNPDFDRYFNRDVPEYIEVEMNSLAPRERPSFHEIRALALFLLEEGNENEEINDDTSARAAHSDKSTTQIYLTGREKWITVKPKVIYAKH